jgi:SPP1 family predicted phage head-tail adaptor
MAKSKISTYNDGVVRIYREKGKRSNFSAKENVSVLGDMEFVAKLDFEEASRREQDLEFANQNDFSLSLKIRTRYLQKVDNKCKAVIDNYLYDVKFVDKTRTEMWLFLEGVRPLVSD